MQVPCRPLDRLRGDHLEVLKIVQRATALLASCADSDFACGALLASMVMSSCFVASLGYVEAQPRTCTCTLNSLLHMSHDDPQFGNLSSLPCPSHLLRYVGCRPRGRGCNVPLCRRPSCARSSASSSPTVFADYHTTTLQPSSAASVAGRSTCRGD